MQIIGAVRESILHARDEKALKLAMEIATIMADQLGEIPEATKRRWKLAEKRASERLQKEGESEERLKLEKARRSQTRSKEKVNDDSSRRIKHGSNRYSSLRNVARRRSKEKSMQKQNQATQGKHEG